jgi:predicted neuraminidase
MTLKTILMLIAVMFVTALYTNGQEKSVITFSELIFPLQEKHVHSSTIVSLPGGDMLAAWFYGSGERKEDDVKIMGARLKRGEKKWSAPFLMADTYGIPDCNPVLFLNSKKKLFLVWIAVQANLWEQSVIRFKTAENYSGGGAPDWNWQDDILLKPNDRFSDEVEKKFRQLPESKDGWAGYAPRYDDMIIEASKNISKRSFGWMTRTQPVILKSGRILLPLYSDGLNMSMMAISDDDGKTWRPSLPVVGRGPIQPALAVKASGEVVAMMRDSGNEPTRVQQSISANDGESWTAARKTNIPNTASVQMYNLKNGKWAFVGNDIDDGRYRLSLFISDDEGATWKWKTTLEEKSGGSFSYPGIVQTTDGLLHITYSYHESASRNSIKYIIVDPEKVGR